MEFLTDLWMPILLSAVFVFIASSVIHMLIPIHKGDYTKMPGEEDVLAAMRKAGVGPGDYAFPCAGSMKDMSDPEFIKKCEQGPMGFATLKPNGPPTMGAALVQWFIYCIAVSVFSAYVASFVLEPGMEYMAVFRLVGTVGFMGYGLGAVTESIWKGVRWSTSIKFMFDGLVYGLVMAGTFAWLWPGSV